jgi:valyl-tRNA synthetase
MINIFTESAHVNENGGKYQGLERFAARKQVLADLTELGLLVEEKPHKLPLALSQRTGVPVEPRLSWQWYVKIKPLADKAIEAVEQGKTKFVPEQWTNTYYSWMRNIHDWCISRQLWWGHQIPAWYEAGADGTVDFETAKVVVSREKPEGGNWVQDPDVLDTWFSSGLWPFSTLGWPNNDSADLRTWYPNSVMETGHDIIFFWVARMMMFGLHFMGEVPFRTVYLHAMVRDEKGEKMSKTKGNVIDPLDIIHGAAAANLPASVKNKYPQGLPPMGADALRFTLASLTQQGRDIRLSVERIEGYKAFVNKIWNASRFALINMGDFQSDPKIFVKDRALSLADRWILSRLNTCIAGVQGALTTYNFGDAASIVYQFLWREFCDWYIELSKGSLRGEDVHARDSSRAVLVYCLDQILRLVHPFMPFISEEIWQRLPMTRPTESICIAAYPTEDRRLADPAAEAEMKPVIEAIEGIRTIRGESQLSPAVKVEAHIQSSNAQVRETLNRWRDYLTPLARLSALYVTELGNKPPQAAAEIRAEMEIYVPLAGIVDLAEERERLKKEIEKAEKEIAGIEGRLSRPDFVARAPAEVVAKDRARVDELRSRINKVNDNLRRIAPVEVKIAAPANDGAVNLTEDLKEELAGVKVQETDNQVKEALEKLREGTKEGLSSRDHYDLGVAYMNMGLVDDAVREFNEAKKGDEPAKKPEAVKKPAPTNKVTPARKAAPAKKPAPAKKKIVAKKAVAKKVAPKKAVAKKEPAPKKVMKKAKKPAAKAKKKR